MTFITKKHISRRTVLRGLGATVALPFLESMLPAMSGQRPSDAGRSTRFVCVENVHGAAGSTKLGAEKYLWAPEGEGRSFDLNEGNLSPLEPWKEHITIVSNLDMKPAEATDLKEVGGDHFRSSAVFLTQAHPKQTQGSDIYCGTSIDQLYAERFGQDTPLPSIQLSIESVDQAGGCSYNYSCVYTDSISWATPTRPLPMVRDPRMVFDMLFGVGATREERAERLSTDRSLLDWVSREAASIKGGLPASDRHRVDDYLETIREIERRIQRIEERNSSGDARALPTAPVGVPDSFADHVKLMFDLQAIAFAGDVTRVSSFKMSRDVTGRSFPECGVNTGFHSASHHGENEQRILQFGLINKYHVSFIAYFLERLKNTPDAGGTLLDNTLVLYGSPMGNGNLHNHKRVPMLLAGHAGGRLRGGVHLKTPDGTAAANLELAMLKMLGLEDVTVFGDSTGVLSL
jgi:hypothetical protein